MYRMMTPGPTEVSPEVLKERAKPFANPDLDVDFVEFYKETCELISRLVHTKNESLILGGEGILGLEAACASLTEPGDRVLVISNGVFGAGFADFVTMYGGEAVVYDADWHEPIPERELDAYLQKDHDFKYATLVHGDTPSGILNDIEAVGKILAKYGIMSVVDAVSTTFADPVYVDDAQIDILCGGSQKALSAPPGLTFVTVSDRAKQAMKNRRVPVASFYANLRTFENYYEEKWFPYTMPASDIYGLRAALDIVAADEKKIYSKHAKLAHAVRSALYAGGLTFYVRHGYANGVSAFNIPAGVTAEQIISTMREDHGILVAGSMGELSGKLIRIGHMGYNANEENMRMVLAALDATFEKLGVELESSLADTFDKTLNRRITIG